VPWSAYRLYLNSGKATLAVMYLQRFQFAGRRFAVALTPAHVQADLVNKSTGAREH